MSSLSLFLPENFWVDLELMQNGRFGFSYCDFVQQVYIIFIDITDRHFDIFKTKSEVIIRTKHYYSFIIVCIIIVLDYSSFLTAFVLTNYGLNNWWAEGELKSKLEKVKMLPNILKHTHTHSYRPNPKLQLKKGPHWLFSTYFYFLIDDSSYKKWVFFDNISQQVGRGRTTFELQVLFVRQNLCYITVSWPEIWGVQFNIFWQTGSCILSFLRI